MLLHPLPSFAPQAEAPGGGRPLLVPAAGAARRWLPPCWLVGGAGAASAAVTGVHGAHGGRAVVVGLAGCWLF